MIPTFNCADYLRETLSSVLTQYPGADQMQIEVIDDCSTKDDPAAVVRELSPDGRVSFYRQPSNGGAIANFNTCISRSLGRLVHILHGDDFVQPGFYDTIGCLASANPDLALFAARCWEVGPDRQNDGISARYPWLEKPTRAPDALLGWNGLRTPGVVVRRSFYEQHGGFLASLPHTADWEMWVRAISEGGGIIVNAPLASYRSHAGSDTSRLFRQGIDLSCKLNVMALFRARHPEFKLQEASAPILKDAYLRYLHFKHLYDREAELACKKIWKANTPTLWHWLQIGESICQRLIARSLRRAGSLADTPHK